MNPIATYEVSRTFGSFTAVEKAWISLQAAEVVGLLGANGAGKTTLIKMILGLLAPTAGRIKLSGQARSRRQRRRIGYIPEKLGVYTDLTARENIEFRADVFGEDVSDLDDRLVCDMSLGLQHRTAFAAAAQHHPDLLILDEPTFGVSPLARS